MIIFSDLHYHEHPEFPTIKIAENVLDQIETYAVNNQCKTIIHLGDLYHSRIKMPIRILKPLIDRFYNWAINKRWEIYLLKGNPTHDGDGVDFNGNLFPFGHYIDRPFCTNGLLQAFFLPFAPKETLLNAIAYWKKQSSLKTPKILFVHYALAGATTNSYEAPIQDSLTKKDVEWFDYVFAGHYHKYQQVFPKAWHVGSPYRVDFGEKDDKKGFIHFTKQGPKFVELNVPKMIEYIIDPSNSYLVIEDPSINRIALKGNFVKIIIRGTETYVKNFDIERCRKNLIKQGSLGVTFKKEILKDEKEVRAPRLQKTDSPEKMLSRYFEYTKDQMVGLDVNKIKRLAQLAMKGGKT